MDIPHIYDIYPRTNWRTSQGPGMENVDAIYLSQRGVEIGTQHRGQRTGTDDKQIPALSMPGRADNGTASSTLLLH